MTFTPSDSTDYATATATVTVNVAKATPTTLGGQRGGHHLRHGPGQHATQRRHGDWTVDSVSTAVSGSFTYTSRKGQGLERPSQRPHRDSDLQPQRQHGLRHGHGHGHGQRGQGHAHDLGGEPVDIIYGTALANTQLTSGTVNWTVNGTSTAVNGTFTYTAAEGARC